MAARFSNTQNMADYLVFLSDSAKADASVIETLIDKCDRCNLDALVFAPFEGPGLKSEYYGVFSGMQLFTKMYKAGDVHATLEGAIYRKSFLRETGLDAFLPSDRFEELAFAIKAISLAARATCARADVSGFVFSGDKVTIDALCPDENSIESTRELVGQIAAFGTSDARFSEANFSRSIDRYAKKLLARIEELEQPGSVEEKTTPAKKAEQAKQKSPAKKQGLLSRIRSKAAKTHDSSKAGNPAVKPTASEAPAAVRVGGVTEVKREVEVIASLTSFPARIDKIAPAIESIMDQQVKADRIVLWLAEEQFPEKEADLPKSVLGLREFGLEILWCRQDIKSYKRSVCSMQEFPESIIIAFDDDLLFPDYTIGALLECYEKHPNAVSAMRVHGMRFDEEGTLLPYNDWHFEDSSRIDEELFDLFATDGAGTLFPPSILPKEAFDADAFMELAPHADDVWLKVMELLGDVPVVLAHEYLGLEGVKGTQEVFSLWSNNKLESGNDVALAAVLDKYGYELLEKCR